MKERILCIFSAFLLLSGCAQPAVEAINFKYLRDLQLDLKRQVGMYVAIAKAEPVSSGPCSGKEPVDFEITAVKLDLITTRDAKIGADLSAKVPISAVSITPSISGSGEVNNTQELQFTEWALPTANQALEGKQRGAFDLRNAEITTALLDIRNAMTSANVGQYRGVQLACFADDLPKKDDKGNYSASSDDGNKFVFGVTITRIEGVGVGLGLGPINFAISDDKTAKLQSTLTVAFAQVGHSTITDCLKSGKCPIHTNAALPTDH